LLKNYIYKNYTQLELDAQYDNRAKVASFPSYVQEWEALCATTMHEYPISKTVCFDNISGQELDIIYPRNMGNEQVPVQIFFHGGYWKALSREDCLFAARAFADYGIATVLVDYQLIPDVSMGELIRQCRQSIAFIYENSDSLYLSKDNIHISGHSAGGHIAAMCLATSWSTYNEDLPNQIVKSAVGLSGLYDLRPISRCFLQKDLGLSGEDVTENSPVLLPEPSAGKFYSIVGDLEGEEYEAQSQALKDAWPNLGKKPEILAPYNHFTIMGALADPTSAPSRFIRNVMNLTSSD